MLSMDHVSNVTLLCVLTQHGVKHLWFLTNGGWCRSDPSLGKCLQDTRETLLVCSVSLTLGKACLKNDPGEETLAHLRLCKFSSRNGCVRVFIKFFPHNIIQQTHCKWPPPMLVMLPRRAGVSQSLVLCAQDRMGGHSAGIAQSQSQLHMPW